ncbi:protein PHTF2-like [Glandiceps talaboti]
MKSPWYLFESFNIEIFPLRTRSPLLLIVGSYLKTDDAFLKQSFTVFVRNIATYDKQLWENSLELQEYKGLHSFPLKTGRVKTELIDVDLVSGSTFSKAKPQYPWPALTRRGLVRVLFFPFFYRWWYHQMSSPIFIALLLLYCLQIISIVVYFTDSTMDTDLEVVSLTEVFGPVIIMILLGTVHSQVVSTNFARPTSPRSKRRRKLRRKSYSKRESHTGSTNESTALESSYEGYPSNAVRSKHNLNSERSQHSHQQQPQAKRKMDLESCAEETKKPEVEHTICEKEQNETEHSSESKEENSTEKKDEKLKDLKYMKKSDEDEITGCSTEDMTVLNTPVENLDIAGNIIIINQTDLEEGESRSNEDIPKSNVDEKLNELIQKSYEEKEKDNVEVVDIDVHVSKKKTDSLLEHVKPAEESQDYIASEEERIISHSARAGLRRRRVKEDKSGKPVAKKDYIPIEEEERKNEEMQRINGRVKTLRVPPYKKDYGTYSSGDSDIDTNPPDTPPPDQGHSHMFLRKRESDMEEHSWTDTAEDPSETESDTSTEETDNENAQIEDEEEHIDAESNIPVIINSSITVTDRVTVRVWDRNECKKTDLSMLEISSLILNKVNNTRVNLDYVFFGIVFSSIIAILPMSHRFHGSKTTEVTINTLSWAWLINILKGTFGSTWRVQLVVLVAIAERFLLGCLFFFLLAVAERTYRQRFLLAKYFGHVTSARKARKSDIPHFRLNKVRNIKTWLSLRSYLKRRGPLRSIDVIVSSAFLLALSLVSLLCVQLLRDSGTFLSNLYNWELVAWCLFLGVFLLRFMTLGRKINKKYKHQNTSALLTEQINLYLHMEQKPHKKEELMLANHVLTLAVKLLNELESPFKISGLAMNPLLYNITRVVVLSAFSGVMTEMLGFKLKLWKIKA